MAASLRLLLALFLFIPFVQGTGQHHCDSSSIQVQTINTGTQIGVDIVFEVEVKNLCPCTIKNLHLNGGGFTTNLEVDPNLFRPDGSAYLVNNGHLIASMATVRFKYAWDHYFNMAPTKLEDDC